MNIEFIDINEFYFALRDIYMLFKQKGNTYEDQLDVLIFQHYEFAKQINSGKFNTTWVKKFTERRII